MYNPFHTKWHLLRGFPTFLWPSRGSLGQVVSFLHSFHPTLRNPGVCEGRPQTGNYIPYSIRSVCDFFYVPFSFKCDKANRRLTKIINQCFPWCDSWRCYVDNEKPHVIQSQIWLRQSQQISNQSPLPWTLTLPYDLPAVKDIVKTISILQLTM